MEPKHLLENELLQKFLQISQLLAVILETASPLPNCGLTEIIWMTYLWEEFAQQKKPHYYYWSCCCTTLKHESLFQNRKQPYHGKNCLALKTEELYSGCLL